MTPTSPITVMLGDDTPVTVYFDYEPDCEGVTNADPLECYPAQDETVSIYAIKHCGLSLSLHGIGPTDLATLTARVLDAIHDQQERFSHD